MSPRSRKGAALLYVVAVQGQEASRAELAELLWGVGRVQNVRQELTHLRQLLGAEEWLDPGDPVKLEVECDVVEFEEAYARDDHARAVELYRAPLLAGFEVPRTPVFGDWLAVERERLEEMYRTALRMRAAELSGQGTLKEALTLLDRLTELDPLDESAHRSAMRISLERGETDAGLARYAALVKVLSEELGTEPLAETLLVYEQLEAASQEKRRQRRARDVEVASAAAELKGLPLRLARFLALGAGTLSVGALAGAAEVVEGEMVGAFEVLSEANMLSGKKLLPAARTAVLAALSDPVARYLHGRIAEALAADDQPALLVAERHLMAHELPDAVEWFVKAAQEAEATVDPKGAINAQYRAVLASADSATKVEQLLRLETLANAQGAANLRAGALDALERETFLLQDDTLLVEARLRRAGQLVQAGKAAEAREIALAASESARRIGSEGLLVRSENAVGVAAFHVGDLTRASEAFEFVAERGDLDTKLAALNNLGALAGIGGDPASAFAYHEGALTVARQIGKHELTAGVLNNLGASSERVAAYDRAAESFTEAATLYEALGNPRGEATAWLNVANVQIKRDELTAAAAALRRAEALNARTEAPLLTCRLLIVKGELKRHQGELRGSLEAFQGAHELATRVGDERQAATASFNLEMARRYLDPELDPSAAEDALSRFEKLGLNDVLPHAYAEMGLAASEASEASRWLEKLAPFLANAHVAELARELEERIAVLHA